MPQGTKHSLMCRVGKMKTVWRNSKAWCTAAFCGNVTKQRRQQRLLLYILVGSYEYICIFSSNRQQFLLTPGICPSFSVDSSWQTLPCFAKYSFKPGKVLGEQIIQSGSTWAPPGGGLSTLWWPMGRMHAAKQELIYRRMFVLENTTCTF